MLRACDAAAQRRGQPCIWLHVRQADEAAQQLYIRWGASEVGRDKPKLGLFGLGGGSFSSNSRPRILMRRQLEPGGAQEAVAAAAAPQQQEESVS
jgi:ribosomal protein S18 acetylase RimI-like enzyme